MEKEKRSSKHKKSKKKVKRTRVILISISLVLLFFICAMVGYGMRQLSQLQNTKISKTDEDLGISDDTKKILQGKGSEDSVTNIALFGLDLREKGENGRSDTIMIVSIDKKHKKIKLSSIMRDTYVKVKGHGETKINHAYSFGGPQLAIRTLNENFQMDIRDYVTVDIFSLEKLIDSLGGVTIDVKKVEIAQINLNMDEVAQVSKSTFKPVTKTGSQVLNGRQAVGYARIRAVGNGDYERSDRQRRVLDAIFQKISSAGVSKYPQIVSQLLPYVETSMTSMDIVSTGTSLLTSGIRNLDQARFPVDGYSSGKTINDVWYLVADMKATREQLHNYIYEDIAPVSK
ncbi:LCP family protein [Clostridium swellfunianum]|uniref:LCP family protein n=1 Tax=Clostridium swellfunianum TaxID=1367462 RepID=UPI00203002C7|nr:LCP family protein [Clostridium swellfunianum]MCM0647448.1 LCP family protein [Clostridium swellfunianum]